MAGEKGDVIKDIFIKQQQNFRELLSATKNLSITVGEFDDAAAKKLTAETDALKKKLDIPSLGERYALALENIKEGAGDSVRTYLSGAAALRAEFNIAGDEGMDLAAMTALDKVEKASGKSLTFSDKAGLEAMKKEVAAFMAGEDKALEEAAKVEESQMFLKKINDDVVSTIENAKARDGIEGVTVDLKSLKI
mmetsp:Transcript_23439/g.73466  ORF Transcript_23439/g.73466 Transcript_23439/m.73466 type:complete len:193 (+) Transcript_23439:528-1106(+)